MQHVQNFVYREWLERHFVQWITNTMILMHVGLAVMIFLGGPERFTPPTYQPLLDYTHNATWPWALWIGTSALFMLSRRPWISIIGLWLGMVWHVVWMSSFVIAMGNSLTAASTPIPMYGAGALICTALLTAKTLELKKE